jgi:hypothetical protein
MVPKWLQSRKSKQHRFLQNDAPPVAVTKNAQESIPPYAFAAISLFQNNHHRHSCINYFAASNSGHAIHLAFLTPSQSSRNGTSIRQIAQDCWVQQNVSDPRWLDREDVWTPWLAHLHSSLINFGGGTLAVMFQGVSIDEKTGFARVYLSGIAGATVITNELELRQIQPGQNIGLIGNLNADLPNAHVLQLSEVSSLVLTSDDYQQERVARGIQEIKKLPYPKAGAAELLFFELQKTGNGSSVLWIDF